MALKGKVLCFTGKLCKPRDEMHEEAERAGALIRKSMSKNVDYLIAGVQVAHNKENTKYKKAVQLGIEVLDEEEYYTRFFSTKEPSSKSTEETRSQSPMDLFQSLDDQELVAICIKLRLKGGVARAECLARLQATDISDVLKKLTVSQLKKILDTNNLSKTGKKAVLIERLVANCQTTAPQEILSKEQSQKIIQLFKGDSESIEQAKFILETLVHEQKVWYSTMKHMMDFPDPKSYSSLLEYFESNGYTASYDITCWIIELAHHVNAPWLAKRIRHYRFEMWGYEWENVSQSLSKETYEFWENGSIDINDYVFNKDDCMANHSIPSEHAFNDGSEWWDIGGGCNESGVCWDHFDPTIVEQIGHHDYKEVEYDGSAIYESMNIERQVDASQEESYAVIVQVASKGKIAIGTFELEEDFDITKLAFVADYDSIEGLYLCRYSGIEYRGEKGTIPIETDLDWSSPKVSTAELIKESEYGYFVEVS